MAMKKPKKMTVGKLISLLNNFDPKAEVRIMTSHDDGDDVMDWQIMDIHDAWTIKKEHDMVSIEIDLDQHPDYWRH